MIRKWYLALKVFSTTKQIWKTYLYTQCFAASEMFSSLDCKAFSFIHLFTNTDWLPCHCCNKHPLHILLLPPFLRNRFYTFQIFICKKKPRELFIFSRGSKHEEGPGYFCWPETELFSNYISLILKQMRNIWDGNIQMDLTFDMIKTDLTSTSREVEVRSVFFNIRWTCQTKKYIYFAVQNMES